MSVTANVFQNGSGPLKEVAPSNMWVSDDTLETFQKLRSDVNEVAPANM